LDFSTVTDLEQWLENKREEFLIMLNIFGIYVAGWIDNYSIPMIFRVVLANVKKYFAKKSMVEILI